MTARRVRGERDRSVLYADAHGFLYARDNKSPRRINLRCVKTKSERCRGRASMTLADDVIRLLHPHNHLPSEERIRREGLLQAIRERVKRDPAPLRHIFDDECNKYPDHAHLLRFSSLRPSLIRLRSRTQPADPETMASYGETLLSPLWRPRFGDSKGNPPAAFVRRVLHGTAARTSVVFAAPPLCASLLVGCPDLHVNATFRGLPRRPGCHCLLTVHVVYRDTAIPVVYALVEKRSEEAFEQIFVQIRDELAAPGMRPSNIVADYDPALRNALARTFQGARLHGSWSHYGQSLLRQARHLGLKPLLSETNGAGRQAIRRLLCWPLLPPTLMETGLREISATAHRLAPLLAHVRRHWAEGVGTEATSVYRQPGRVDRAVEDFHRNLRGRFKTKPPTIWEFTSCLRDVDYEARRLHRRLEDGVESPPGAAKRSRSVVPHDEVIRRATARLEDGVVSVAQFLDEVAVAADHIEEAFLLEDDDEDAGEPGVAVLPPPSREDGDDDRGGDKPGRRDDYTDGGDKYETECTEDRRHLLATPGYDATQLALDDIVTALYNNADLSLPHPDKALLAAYPEENLEGETEALMCTFCWCRRRTTVFLPCRHFHLCRPCSSAYRDGDSCPTCRTPIVSHMHIFA